MENNFNNQKLSYFLKQYKRAVLYDTSDSNLQYEVRTFINKLCKKDRRAAIVFGGNQLIRIKNWTIHYIVWHGSGNAFSFSGFIDTPIGDAPSVIKTESVLQMPVKELIPLVYILTQHERRK